MNINQVEGGIKLLEEARDIMCSLYSKYGLCEASLKASELVDQLLLLEIGGKLNE